VLSSQALSLSLSLSVLHALLLTMHGTARGVCVCLWLGVYPNQDNYTQSQPGIQRRILRLKELIQRIDGPCRCRSWVGMFVCM
jgi:hypothetical protein